MENDQFDGFLLKGGSRPNLNARGGRTTLEFLAIAESPEYAIWLVGKLGFLDAKIIDRGPAVLVRAKQLGVKENDARVLD